MRKTAATLSHSSSVNDVTESRTSNVTVLSPILRSNRTFPLSLPVAVAYYPSYRNFLAFPREIFPSLAEAGITKIGCIRVFEVSDLDLDYISFKREGFFRVLVLPEVLKLKFTISF